MKLPEIVNIKSIQIFQDSNSANCHVLSFFFQPKDLVTGLHDDLVKEKLASLDSAKAFIKVLKSFRSSGKSTIAEVLTSPDSYYIV